MKNIQFRRSKERNARKYIFPLSTLKCNTGGRQSLSSGQYRSAWLMSQGAAAKNLPRADARSRRGGTPFAPGRVTLERGRSPGQRPLENFRRSPVVQRLARPAVEQVLHAVRRGPACRSPCTGEPARCSFRPRSRYGCAKKNNARPGNLPVGRELLAVVRCAHELLVRPRVPAHRFARFPGRPVQGQQREPGGAVHQRQHGAPVRCRCSVPPTFRSFHTCL